jgi:hypothetical protein
MPRWRKLASQGYPNYSASEYGRIKNRTTKRLLKASLDDVGYYQVGIMNENGHKDTVLVHKLVLIAFNGDKPAPDMTVDHINRVRSDNRIINLRWSTWEQQGANSYHGPKPGNARPVRQLENNDERELIKVWPSQKEAAESLGLKAPDLSKAVSKGHEYGGFYWEKVEPEIIEGEKWTDLKNLNFKGFKISSMGRFKTREGHISYGYRSRGYLKMSVMNDGVKSHLSVHVAVYESFVSNEKKPKYVVNHIDGNKRNNVLTNLEYITSRGNALHAIQTGLHVPYTRKVCCYNFDEKTGQKTNKVASYNSIVEAANAVGGRTNNINDALRGRYKTSSGFIWEYEDDIEKDIFDKDHNDDDEEDDEEEIYEEEDDEAYEEDEEEGAKIDDDDDDDEIEIRKENKGKGKKKRVSKK